MIIGHRGIGIAVEFPELVYVIPNSFVIGMENVGPILMDRDALDIVGVDISGDVVPLLQDQHGLPGFFCLVGEHRPEKPCADDQIIVHHQLNLTTRWAAR